MSFMGPLRSLEQIREQRGHAVGGGQDDDEQGDADVGHVLEQVIFIDAHGRLVVEQEDQKDQRRMA